MKNYSEITPYIEQLANLSDLNNGIKPEMYSEYHVYRGLRDINGNGVVAGLTEVSHIKAKDIDENGNAVPCEGRLFYRGIDIKDIVNGFLEDNRPGFEETIYLLLFSKLPTENELSAFSAQLAEYRSLPPSFVRDMILKAPGKDMMNILSRSVLALYAYDENPDDISTSNVLRQCLQLIAQFPLLSVYGYQSFQHYHNGNSLLYIFLSLNIERQKIFYIYFAKTVSFRRLKQKFLILRLFCMQNTGAVIILHLQHTL